MNGLRTFQYDIFTQLRLPLIILVTFAHSYGGVSEGYDIMTSGWDSYELLKIMVSQTLVKVAMPVFFVMSGYLFFANITRWNAQIYWQKIKRRFKTLLIPYLIWNLLMAVKLHTFNLSIFWEPANMPLWFLRDLMVVSLFTQLVHYVLFLSFIDNAFFDIFGSNTWALSIHYLLCPLIKAVIFITIYYIYRQIRISKVS